MAYPFGSVTSADLPRRSQPPADFAHRLRRWRRGDARGGGQRASPPFDPLQPRLLLSADVLSVNLAQTAAAHQDHNLVVEMVTQAVQTGNTSQDVQRVEVVDQAQNNAVLAVGDLSVIKSVSVVGDATSADNDT